MLPWERHPHESLLIALSLNASLGVCRHETSQTCAFLHPHRIEFPLEPVDFTRDHAMLVSRGPVTTHLGLERRVTEMTHRCVHFRPIVVLGVEVLGIFDLVLWLFPRIGVWGCLYFRNERGARGRHPPIGIGIIVVEEQLDILGRDLAARLIVDQLEWDVVRVDVQYESWWRRGCCASLCAWLLVSRSPSPINSRVRWSWASHGRNREGIFAVVVVFLVAAVFVVPLRVLFLGSEDVGYVGSGSRPPWVRIYCPQSCG